ncbi:thiolase-like protein [Aspergillus navahoensis]
MDHYMGANGAGSLPGRCHTFDSKADGYIKAEAVNMVYLQRISDAINDKDPIRAIIRGTATNSDGWTTGIASPNPEAQSAAIRQAYRNAGICGFSLTNYIEFHGTGTRVGDSLEANGAAAVFTPFQAPNHTKFPFFLRHRPLMQWSLTTEAPISPPKTNRLLPDDRLLTSAYLYSFD